MIFTELKVMIIDKFANISYVITWHLIMEMETNG